MKLDIKLCILSSTRTVLPTSNVRLVKLEVAFRSNATSRNLYVSILRYAAFEVTTFVG